MSELIASVTHEGWRIRLHKPGQRMVRYYNIFTYATKEEALDAIEKVVLAPYQAKWRLGVQWVRVTTESGECDWVRN